MHSKLVRYLFLSQASFFVFLGICIAVLPKFLFERNEGGLSNYGVHAATVAPYTLAFLLCAIFIARAARSVPSGPKSSESFRRALYALAGLSILVLVTTYPYKLDKILDNLHIAAAILVFCFETAMAIWLAFGVFRDRWNMLFLTIELTGIFLAFFTLVGRLHLLFAAQLITSLAFGIILIRTGLRLDNQSHRHKGAD